MTYRYLGRVVDPAGTPTVFLGKMDQSLAVSAGTRLDDGFVVEAIDASAVRLHHLPSDTRFTVSIPSAAQADRP